MANPTPIYRVQYDGNLLPGYVQTEEQPLTFRVSKQDILNRNGGLLYHSGAGVRDIPLTFHVLSRLSTYSTGLDHLNDCKAQYKEALSILSRASSTGASLYVGDMTRYTTATVESITAPLASDTSRMISYTVKFTAQPFYLDDTEKTATFSGNGTVNITLGDTRETYPIFTIPNTVTAFVATHASGRVVDFTRGTFSTQIIVNCGNYTVLTPNDVDRSGTMNNVNFGIAHTSGAGTFSVDITGFSGSGSVTVGIRERYEL